MVGSALDAKLASVLGGRTATAFEKAFGIRTAADLLSHYPRRYAKRGELSALDELPLDENVTIIAEVREVRERSMKARRGTILEVRITDGKGFLTLTFFNQAWRAKMLVPGMRGIFAGKVTAYRGALQLAHPDYELFDPWDDDLGHATPSPAAIRWAESPIPIYPATSTLASWQIAKSIELVLDGLGPVADPVPPAVRAERGLVDYRAALEGVHRPKRDADWRAGQHALRFQEAFVLQAALLQQRAANRSWNATPRTPVAGGFLERFDRQLPFALTGDQQLVGEEIARDLAGTHPMNRLIQGEVGSGKTLVALRAMLAVADSGGQAALLAPTEVLAAQHLRSLVRVLGPNLAAELMPTLITGQLPVAERRKALLRTVGGQARIVVGTHALLGESVTFYDLGLVVVDEQHRFGVDQREALRQKGTTPPHVLVLTATPIPRTVAMTVFGDLDISTISELPAGRKGIETFVVPLAEKPDWINRVWARVSEELEKGHQAFVVCPAIEPAPAGASGGPAGTGGVREDDDVDPDAEAGAPQRPLTTVVQLTAELRAHPLLAGRRVEGLHGRMSSDEKDELMRGFAAGRIDVLVATTVIEVGVDVPNASTMVVMDAERFGVSQLHQLRGRVGRGGVPGLCLLVTGAEESSLGRERVDAVASTLDGFELAQADLELRREGDVLGSSQSGGRSSLRLLRVVRDTDVIEAAREQASGILDADPSLSEHPELAAAIARRLDESTRTFLAKA
ncbi:ATP-dependent DNA helicase RecG [Planctomonas deserti]|uniref:ATP-dependent DNA helicase RecG n=1 Tax=Planctomonas deserti TaxID=2144185 RepID=UPI000D399C38|nr:ATP-dependent DNA helicase RecG [Planctomonas deserti]